MGLFIHLIKSLNNLPSYPLDLLRVQCGSFHALHWSNSGDAAKLLHMMALFKIRRLIYHTQLLVN